MNLLTEILIGLIIGLLCLTLLTGCNKMETNDQRGVVTKDLWVRKLTPIEYFRLMGFKDEEINLADLSNTQRYKLAGNGWDINLVSKIFNRMFK
jgi:site-specific DNA-cytosine methylase